MKLTRTERNALLSGNLPRLRRTGDRPPLEPGDVLIVARIARTPTPTMWITVTQIARHRKGDWIVRYDLTDNRDPALFPARGGDHYTTDPTKASDDLEAVLNDRDRKRIAVEARARRAQQTNGSDSERRRRERAVRTRIREALTGLPPDAQTALLVDIENAVRRAQTTRLDDAA